MATQSLIRLALRDGGPIPPVPITHVRRRAIRWAEGLLMAFGVLCLGYYLYATAEARLYQSFEDRELNEVLNSATPAATVRHVVDAAAVSPPTIPAGATIGRIDIPRLGVSAVIRAGSDARTLRLAVGYVPGTALPGEQGNVGLAGHRDTFFRKLRDINPDDEIRIVTTAGIFHYYVQRTNIVMPRDVWVLDPTNDPALTLVTCYPFSYIGSAPKRFVVRAVLGTPDVAPGTPNTNLDTPKAAFRTSKVALRTSKPTKIRTSKAALRTSKPTIRTSKVTRRTSKATIRTSKATIDSSKTGSARRRPSTARPYSRVTRATK
jgi:sortase A